MSETYNADDEWFIYWYICGTNLVTISGTASKDISEMEKVKFLLPNTNFFQTESPSNGRIPH